MDNYPSNKTQKRIQMKKIRQKKAAIELSMTTIIVVVLSLVLLILGFFLVRNIMCGAITFSNEINEKVGTEIATLFETRTSELVCIGGERDKTYFEPGEQNYIWCKINSKTSEKYRIKLDKLFAPGNEIGESALYVPGSATDWVLIENWGWPTGRDIAPNDRTLNPVITIEIPENAPLIDLRAEITVEKQQGTQWETITGSKDIKIEIREKGNLRAAIC